MRKILRLVYVSCANFDFDSQSSGMPDEIRDILITSRKNNQNSNIHGVLYFANGYFFQCLEGKESAVYSLLEDIKRDPRHTNLKVSYCKKVWRHGFAQWSMKYVALTSDIDSLIAKRGYHNFSPTEFTEHDVNLLVELFTNKEDTTVLDAQLNEHLHTKTNVWQGVRNWLTQRLHSH